MIYPSMKKIFRHFVFVVDKILKQEAFQKRVQLARDAAEVDRAAEDDAIGRGQFVQDRGQGIVNGAAAVALAAQPLALKAAQAGFVLQIVQVDEFRRDARTGVAGTIQGAPQERGCIFGLPRAAVDCVDGHVGLLEL